MTPKLQWMFRKEDRRRMTIDHFLGSKKVAMKNDA